MDGLTSGAGGVTGDFPVTINGVEIKTKPQKVLVMSDNIADVAIELGNEASMVASTIDCTQPELNALPKIDRNDTQAITGTNADLIITSTMDESLQAALSGVNIPVLSIEPASSREDYERLFAQVSAAFSGDGAGYDAGLQSARKLFKTMDDIQRTTDKNTVTTACYLYDTDRKAVTGDMFGTVIMDYSGLTNIFKSQDGGAYDFETLKISNPDVIFCAPGLKDVIENNSDFKALKAVGAGDVYEIEVSYMERQGRTIINAAITMSQLAFPELTQENSATVTDPTEAIESAVSSALQESSALSSALASYTALKDGDSGDAVLDMQKRLDELGYLETEYDGHYGSYTQAAVEEFQEKNKLEKTGDADAETQRLLFSKDALKKSD